MRKLEDYEAMKGITILLVVFAHVTRMFAPRGAVPIMHSPILDGVTSFIYIFHMPAFVAVSGAVYYFVKRERGKYNDQKSFISNKAKRLMIPFLFFSFAVVLPTLLFLGLRDNVVEFTIKEVILWASGTHLWYSAMIFMVFVVFNLLENRIYNNEEWVSWAIFIFFNIFSFVIPNAFQVTNTLRYLVFFYAGYWFQKNKDEIYPVFKTKLIPTLLITFGIYLVLFHTPVENTFLLKRGFEFIGGLSGTAVLYILSDKFSRSASYRSPFFQETIASSYGIYLVHPMLVYLISYWEQGINVNPYILAVFNFVFVLIVSMATVRIMRKMNLHIFLGENKPNKTPLKVVDNS